MVSHNSINIKCFTNFVHSGKQPWLTKYEDSAHTILKYYEIGMHKYGNLFTGLIDILQNHYS